MNHFVRRPWALVGTVAIGLLAGCGDGPELAPVSGTVLLDGQPLIDALVLFTPIGGGRPSAARTDEHGEYELIFTESHSGALPGEHLIRISTFQEGDPDGDDAPAFEQVPSRYNTETELARNVELGSNTLDFQLDSRGLHPQGRLASRPR